MEYKAAKTGEKKAKDWNDLHSAFIQRKAALLSVCEYSMFKNGQSGIKRKDMTLEMYLVCILLPHQ